MTSPGFTAAPAGTASAIAGAIATIAAVTWRTETQSPVGIRYLLHVRLRGMRFGCHGEPLPVASFFGVTEIARLVAASARAPISCDDPIASNVQFFFISQKKIHFSKANEQDFGMSSRGSRYRQIESRVRLT